MICTLTARRVKPGAGDAFRATFEAAADTLPSDAQQRWTRVYVCQDVADENVVLTFGFFDGTLSELREAQKQLDYDAYVARFAPHVESVLLDGSYEVVEEITP
jgi:hypothetical protein